MISEKSLFLSSIPLISIWKLLNIANIPSISDFNNWISLLNIPYSSFKSYIIYFSDYFDDGLNLLFTFKIISSNKVFAFILQSLTD